MKRLMTLLILCFALFASPLVPAQTVVEDALANQVLHQDIVDEPQSIDPHVITGLTDSFICMSLFEGLMSPDPKTLKPTPGVAKSWEISADAKVYKFFLREEAKWSNGDPITAQDFVYSWQRVLSPALASQYAYMLHYLKNAKDFNEGKITDFAQVGVKAIDSHTLEVTLENPTPYFLYIAQFMTLNPVHKATIEKFGKMDERGTKWIFPGNMVSNGPFMLKTWSMNEKIVVVKNPNYWNKDIVKLNEIHFYSTGNETNAERKFRAGELHLTYDVPHNKKLVYKKENPDVIRFSPFLATYYYTFNVKKAPFDNKLVRQALASAINREELTEYVTKGGDTPYGAFTPPDLGGYTPSTQQKFDLQKAKELLAKAGYPDGKGFPKIEFLYNTSDRHRMVAEAVQQMLKKNLNIEIELVNQDWKVYLDRLAKIDYQIIRRAWVGDYPDPNAFLELFLTDGGNNKTGWSNPTYDQFITQASQTLDMNQRNELFKKAEEILIDEAPLIPLYVENRTYLIDKMVKGWYPNLQDQHPYQYVSLEK